LKREFEREGKPHRNASSPYTATRETAKKMQAVQRGGTLSPLEFLKEEKKDSKGGEKEAGFPTSKRGANRKAIWTEKERGAQKIRFRGSLGLWGKVGL